jgi:CarD family transcriptional regulator
MKISAVKPGAKTGSGSKSAAIAKVRPGQDVKPRGAALPKVAEAAAKPAPRKPETAPLGKAQAGTAKPAGPKGVAARLGNPTVKKMAAAPAASRKSQISVITDDPKFAAAPARNPPPAGPHGQGMPAIADVPHEPTPHKSETVKTSTAAKKTDDDTLPGPEAAAEQIAAPIPEPPAPTQAEAPVPPVIAVADEPAPAAVAAPVAAPAPAPAPANQSPMRHGGPHRGYSHARGATGRPTPRPPAAGEGPQDDEDEDDDSPPRPRLPATLETFAEGDHVVYPTHGVGKVEKIAVEEIAGHKLELIHITFEENRMTLRVPVAKARSAGLRKLATRKMFDEALAVLKGRARIKRTMWSRRAQEYEAKINSGDPLAIAEVVRDLHRNAGQPDQSFSERQIYEAAMDRLAAELAALDETDKPAAAVKLANFLKTV